MADKKRKVRDETKHKTEKRSKKSKSKTPNNNSKKGDRRKIKKSGPRLPAFLRKELDGIDPKDHLNSEEDEEINSDEGNDLYEYEEAVAEEELKKNRRFDPVENYEYELPEDFEDENVESDDDENGSRMGNINQLDNDVEEEDDERHLRMLHRMQSEALEGNNNKKNIVLSEAYPESEYNTSRDVIDGNGRVTIEDLVESLKGKSGYRDLRKRTDQMNRTIVPLQPPLPKEARDKLERKAAYEQSKKDITKWEPQVKRNREAPTIIFDKDIDLGFSTVGAIASEFTPRTEFEKKMATLVYDEEVMRAHKEDGARLLELNKVSDEDYIQNRNRIAKMRSLLFRHEVKMKRIKKIKSKMYHRLLKKDRLKSASAEIQMNTEAAKELAMKQEYKRAEERMTLRHKNRNKWARRILERGLNAQDEGTRAAMAEQLHQHSILTRKMNSMKDSSSSDDSDDEEDDENSAGSDQDGASKVLAKAKEKTLKVLEEDDELPKSGVLALPFMERALRKKKEAAVEEAGLALQDYESSLKQLEDTLGAENAKTIAVSGRRVFGASTKQVMESNYKIKSNNNSSDSEDELEAIEDVNVGLGRANDLRGDVEINSVLINEGSETPQTSVLKSLDIAGDPGPKTSYEVTIFESGTWKKMNHQNELDTNIKNAPKVVEPVTQNQDLEEVGEESDTDNEGQMVDGILSLGDKPSYELPSQAELIRQAFAADDIENKFIKDKEEILNEENPEPEKPLLLPGWGQWTNIQKKKGLPSWMVEEHEIAKRKREAAIKKRKDAHLKHVIISEKLDKKAEKLYTKTLPYPFTSKEVFEQSIRMPIGPEFNPATAVGALNRPEVMKRPGLIIKPIKFEDVDPFEKADEHKQNEQKQKQRIKKGKGRVKPVVAKS